MTFGLTPTGFNSKRLADVVTDLENAILAQFGDANLDPQSVFGQLIGVMAKAYADIWDNMAAVYYSQYPNSATGISLDNVVQFNGISRLPATQTLVTGVLTGSEGTLIPVGTLASISSQSQTFQSILSGSISATTAYSLLCSVTNITNNAYVVQINGQNFTYSLPIITFTGSFVTGNSIVVTLDGVQLTAVPFTTDSNTTLGLIATQIATAPSVASATPSAGTTITIVPNSGFTVTINSIVITGGVSQPTYAITFGTPISSAVIVNALVAIINASPLQQPVTASNSSGNLLIVSNSVSESFNGGVGTNMSILTISSPIPFVSQIYGPIPCPIGALDAIITPIAGWQSITNPVAGLTGTNTETDAALRLRRLISIAISGNATIEAIRAKLLAVPGVTAALVFENPTVTQDEIDIILNSPLITGNTIVVVLNSIILPTITYAISNLATMTQIAQLIAAQDGIASCVVTGVGNNELAINMLPLNQVVINSFTVSGGASQAIATITGGRPAKSFEAVVQGGQSSAIGEAIWLSKPAGIETFGNTSVVIVDSMGENQTINYSIPTPIYIWVEVVLTLYPEETFPVDGIQQVAQAIYNYGAGNPATGQQALGIGVDVLLQRVNAQIFKVSGIASGAMQIAATSSPFISPSFGSSDISISESQISTWSLAMINVTVV